MKRAIVGLMMLGLVGVASAETLTYLTTGDHSWTNSANWTNSLGAADVPEAGDTVNVEDTSSFSEGVVITDGTAAAAAELNLGPVSGSGYATIEEGATLTLSLKLNLAGKHATSGRLTNRGTLTARGIGCPNGSAYLWNYGTINLTGTADIDMYNSRNCFFRQYAGSITCDDLYLRGAGGFTARFDMMGGTVVGDALTTDDPSTGAVLNLTGGTMTFNDVTFFDSANNTMTVQSPGMLVVTKDMRTYLQAAIDGGQITSDADLSLTYVDGNTILKVPAGTLVSIQ